MNEFIVDKEYKLVKNDPNRNVWDVYKNGELLPKADKLYKYYPLSTYSLDSLLRHYFFLSKPETFNDPFDCNINLLEEVEGKKKLETVTRNCFKNVGICCLSETIDNHLMWAHYTNNYNGFVLEFDDMQVDINKNDYKQFALSRVIYPSNPPRVKSELPFSHQYLFTTKLKHWEYEKEWRIVTDLNTDNREMPFSTNVVTGIYIGHKVPDNNIGLYKMLLEIQELKFPKASIYVVYPHPNDLKLKFEKVWN
ncbi:MAG: DUF2971 domain-containing protein [Bacteroidales bacterium]|nr:DUF2971 domain-containing protein [Bacteroidales bacterium]